MALDISAGFASHPSVEAEVAEISKFASWADNSVSFEIEFADLLFAVGALLRELSDPVET